MDEQEQKEEKLYKAAREKLLTVMKSKQGYMIVDYYTERIVAGYNYSFSIEEVERFIKNT